MSHSPNPSNDQNNLDIDFNYFFRYLGIIMLNFIVPLWVATIINEGVAIWKIFNWYQMDVLFWEDRSNYLPTLLIFFVPIIYIYWFFHLAVKKVLLALHHDVLKKWNYEMSKLLGQILINRFNQNKGINDIFDLDGIIIWINQKIATLPKWLQWITKKLFDQIPYLELINSFDYSDLENLDEQELVSSIEAKINEIQLSLINDSVPFWMNFIIPVNILLLLYYINL